MTQHDFKFRLQHMPDNAKEALSLIENKKRDDLQAVIQHIKGLSLEQPLQYVNFRD